MRGWAGRTRIPLRAGPDPTTRERSARQRRDRAQATGPPQGACGLQTRPQGTILHRPAGPAPQPPAACAALDLPPPRGPAIAASACTWRAVAAAPDTPPGTHPPPSPPALPAPQPCSPTSFLPAPTPPSRPGCPQRYRKFHAGRAASRPRPKPVSEPPLPSVRGPGSTHPGNVAPRPRPTRTRHQARHPRPQPGTPCPAHIFDWKAVKTTPTTAIR